MASVDCLTCSTALCAALDECPATGRANGQTAAATQAGRAGIQGQQRERGPVLLCQGPAGVQGERCQAEGNQARRKLILFEVSPCQIKEIKDLFGVKQGEIKEMFFRFQSKPLVQFNLFSLAPPFACFLHQSQRNGSSRRGSSLGFVITKETEIKAIQEAVSCLHHPNVLLHTALPREINP